MHNAAATRTIITNIPRVFGFTFAMYNGKHVIEIPENWEGHKLFAVVVHQGDTSSGHYALAVMRHGKWYLKDDDGVVPMVQPPTKGPFYLAWYRS